jgi:uncharacterized membrane protein
MKKKKQKKKQTQLEDFIFPNWTHLQKYSVYIVVLISIAAFIIRAYRIGYLTVWLDEYMHIMPALDVLKGNSMNQGDINGIFLTWLITGFFKLFGISEGVARIPSILLGTATIPLIYILAKKLYNNSIGIISAFLYAFSLYVICWSRLARNYASFGFAYILLIIVIWLVFNSVSKTDKKSSFLNRNGINQQFLIIFPFAFIFSFLNHQLTFFSIFGLSFYILTTAIHKIIKREPKPFSNLYSILSYFIIAGTIIFITPYLLDLFARPVLNILLPERIINFILPDWEFIFEQLKSANKLKSFMLYFNVFKNDYTHLYYLSALGVIASFFIPKKRKEALFMFSMFIIPLFMMSFIFREPCTPNYLYYLYPMFLIYIAIFIYFLFNKIFPLIFKETLLQKKWFNNFCLLTILITLFVAIPKDEIKSLLTTKTHGQIVNKSLFHSSFTNWKELTKQVKPYVQEQDLVFSTWPQATDFYLQRDNSVRFRQRRFDPILRKYVNREPSEKGNSGYSLEDVQRTFKENKTGWLFADFYFYNVLTDPRARDFAIRNMDYHFNLGKNGDIKVFSWDHNRPKKNQNSLIIELGKNEKKIASKELKFTVQNINGINKGIVLIIEAEGVDAQNEAFVAVNGKQAIFTTSNNSKRQFYQVFLQKSWLKQGENMMQFYYNAQVIDYPKGFVIYNIKFLNQ